MPGWPLSSVLYVNSKKKKKIGAPDHARHAYTSLIIVIIIAFFFVVIDIIIIIIIITIIIICDCMCATFC